MSCRKTGNLHVVGLFRKPRERWQGPITEKVYMAISHKENC